MESHSVFSVDDSSDGFWSPHAPTIGQHGDADVQLPSSSSAAGGMNRSLSEWSFQRFIQEATAPDYVTTTFPTDDVVKIKANHHHRNDNQHPPPAVAAGFHPQNSPMDPEGHQAFLKSRLQMACAAVALTWENNGKAFDSVSSAAVNGSQVLNSSSSKANGSDPSKAQVKDFGGAVGVPPTVPAILMKPVVQVRSTTSGSSGDQSDDDEAEGDTSQNMDPADTKLLRRKLSNRESARRSRKRKQAHMTERETQVSQLRGENSTLLKRLTDINQKYNEAAVDNRVLKADVETLRAKVKMAEESVKRVTGFNSLFHAMSETVVPSFSPSPESSAEAALQIQDVPTQHYYHSMSNNHITNHRIQNNLLGLPAAENVPQNVTAANGGNKVGRTSAMQRVASLEHLQKRIREEH